MKGELVSTQHTHTKHTHPYTHTHTHRDKLYLLTPDLQLEENSTFSWSTDNVLLDTCNASDDNAVSTVETLRNYFITTR